MTVVFEVVMVVVFILVCGSLDDHGSYVLGFCCIFFTLWSQAAFHNLPHFSKERDIMLRGFYFMYRHGVFTLYFISRSFAIREKNVGDCQQSYLCLHMAAQLYTFTVKD